MLRLSVIKQGLYCSGGYSTCIVPLQVDKAEGLFHCDGIWERLTSLPAGFYACRDDTWAKHAFHHFGTFHGDVMSCVASCGIFQVC